jgi:flagellar biosynthesis/type III secretory pathway protein FliH
LDTSEPRLTAAEQRVAEQDARIQAQVEQARTSIIREHEQLLYDMQKQHDLELNACRQEYEDELEQVRSALAVTLSSTQAAIQRVISDAHPALLQLSTAIAETLTGATLRETEIDAVVAAVSWAIEELAHEQSVDIYLNPSTLNQLQDKCDIESLSHGTRIRWHGKPELSAEDWIASSSNTSIRRVRSEVLERMANVLSQSIAIPTKRRDESAPGTENQA